MPQLSLKGLAKFMLASPSNQRKILYDFKYPDPEGQVQAIYYREARDFINSYHRHNHPPEWLTKQAEALASLAQQSMGRTKARLNHNSNALKAYQKSAFARKKYKILKDFRLHLSFSGVVITISPDLYVEEKSTKKLIKLEMSKEEPSKDMIKIICQSMFEAAYRYRIITSSSSILLIDVRRGISYKGARMGSRTRNEIEAACENISILWDSI